MEEATVEQVTHCLEKVRAIAGLERPTQRDLLQLGYNLGRLSELAALGRETCWDAWKGPVESWNRQELDAALIQLSRASDLWNRRRHNDQDQARVRALTAGGCIDGRQGLEK